jgi:uncharacterized protein YuzB (UPF0349 family)
MNEFRTCNICQGFDSEKVVEGLKKLDSNANIIVGCQSMCAIGARQPFVIVNGIPVIGESEEDVLKKVEGIMNK